MDTHILKPGWIVEWTSFNSTRGTQEFETEGEAKKFVRSLKHQEVKPNPVIREGLIAAIDEDELFSRFGD
jgi:hypothetical protein